MASRDRLEKIAQQWYPGRGKNIWAGSQEKRFQSLTDPGRLASEHASRLLANLEYKTGENELDFDRQRRIAELTGASTAKSEALKHQRELELEGFKHLNELGLEGVKHKGALGLKALELGGKLPSSMLNPQQTMKYMGDREKDFLSQYQDDMGNWNLPKEAYGPEGKVSDKALNNLRNKFYAEYDSARLPQGVSLYDPNYAGQNTGLLNSQGRGQSLGLGTSAGVPQGGVLAPQAQAMPEDRSRSGLLAGMGTITKGGQTFGTGLEPGEGTITRSTNFAQPWGGETTLAVPPTVGRNPLAYEASPYKKRSITERLGLPSGITQVFENISQEYRRRNPKKRGGIGGQF